MISDFIRKETLRLRYVLDIFIIFLIREVIILSANKNKDYFDIVFLLFVILYFLFLEYCLLNSLHLEKMKIKNR